MKFEKILILLVLGLFIISCASENVTGEARLDSSGDGEQLELAEGEAATVTLRGVEYEVYAALISGGSAAREARDLAHVRLAVNGEMSGELSSSGAHTYDNGARVQVEKLSSDAVSLTISADPALDYVNFELEEAETQTYTVGNREYEVNIAQVSSSGARIAVNGEMSPQLASGEVHEYDNGAEASIQGVSDPVVAVLLSAPVMPPTDGVSDVIRVNDTKTYDLEGEQVELGYVYYDAEDNTARVSINGEVSDDLAEGDSYLTQGDLRIGFTLDEILLASQESVIDFTMQLVASGNDATDEHSSGDGEQLELAEGEAATVTLRGVEYEVYAALISGGSAARDARDLAHVRLAVNGEMSGELSSSGAHTYDNGARVQVEKLSSDAVSLTISADPELDYVNFELEEAETQTYTVGNREYEVNIAQVSSSGARIAVNGEMSPQLASGEVHEYDNGAEASIQGVSDPVVAVLLSAPVMPPTDGVSDVLRIDDTKTYDLEGEQVELGYVYYDAEDNTARVSINGEVSDDLAEGDSYLTQGDLRIGFTLDEILLTSQESVIDFTMQLVAGGNDATKEQRR